MLTVSISISKPSIAISFIFYPYFCIEKWTFEGDGHYQRLIILLLLVGHYKSHPVVQIYLGWIAIELVELVLCKLSTVRTKVVGHTNQHIFSRVYLSISYNAGSKRPNDAKEGSFLK